MAIASGVRRATRATLSCPSWCGHRTLVPMRGAGSLGRSLGITFGSYLGRQLALGACRDDDDGDDLERRPFRARVPLASLPARVDLRPWMTKVEEQGALGSCTSNALVGALEYLEHRESGSRVDLS